MSAAAEQREARHSEAQAEGKERRFDAHEAESEAYECNQQLLSLLPALVTDGNAGESRSNNHGHSSVEHPRHHEMSCHGEEPERVYDQKHVDAVHSETILPKFCESSRPTDLSRATVDERRPCRTARAERYLSDLAKGERLCLARDLLAR